MPVANHLGGRMPLSLVSSSLLETKTYLIFNTVSLHQNCVVLLRTLPWRTSSHKIETDHTVPRIAFAAEKLRRHLIDIALLHQNVYEDKDEHLSETKFKRGRLYRVKGWEVEIGTTALCGNQIYEVRTEVSNSCSNIVLTPEKTGVALFSARRGYTISDFSFWRSHEVA